MEEKFIKYNSQDLRLIVSNYYNNKRLYLGLERKDYEDYWDVTHNLDLSSNLGKDIVYLDSSLSKQLKSLLKRKGIIEEIVGEMPYNLGMYEIAKVNLEKIKEYDKDGFKSFEEEYNKCYGKENNKKINQYKKLKHKSNEIEI